MQPRTSSTPSPNAPEAACPGSIEAPYGLVEVNDPALLNAALGQPGKGGLCKAKVFKVKQPLTVYRVWDSTKPRAQYGRWWSFEPPAGPVDAYRAKHEICTSWSRLNRVTQCHLKVGTEIVIGPGQSAQCTGGDDDLSYPPSAATQVYIANDSTPAGKAGVHDCLHNASWPQ
ncbi:hypothetical protein LJR230_002644 [Trinickia sp. LjRoot230]|uniref:hypothetical protein n=1 Tax=Trinickia sp. LjRoot230 TaxID=3342288 RepID=UPI003ED0D149